MQHLGAPELVLILLLALALFRPPRWRGGSPPAHPIPGDDSPFLTRARSRRQ